MFGGRAKLCHPLCALYSLDLSHGVINVEFLLTDRGIKIIDINPQPGGYYINEWMNTIAGVCTFTAEVILHSDQEYFVQPLVNSQSITGCNVLSKKELAGEIEHSQSKTRMAGRVFN